ncbi:NAD-dependent epimerase/dehydratase family protein [Candidatus Micrarchaeota archaeon]|nr:NAD-dependent epimerase/dehydratase family protein [Candidatus Micrarchaeota archaeon]
MTGGAGFIGSHIVEALVRENDVTVIDDLSTGRYINKKTRMMKKNILDDIYFDADVVFHLAAQVSVPRSFENPQFTLKTNVEGTRNVLEACLKSGVKKAVFSSSAAVYGNADHSVSEDEPLRPQDPYGQSKMEGEKLMERYHEENGLQTISLRYFNVYGPRMSGGVVKAFLQNPEPVITGNGKQMRDFVFVKDVVEANLIAAGSKAAGAFNVGTGNAVSVISLADTIEKVTKKKCLPVFVSERKNDIFYSCANTKKAEKILGFRAGTSLEDGIKRTISMQ